MPRYSVDVVEQSKSQPQQISQVFHSLQSVFLLFEMTSPSLFSLQSLEVKGRVMVYFEVQPSKAKRISSR